MGQRWRRQHSALTIAPYFWVTSPNLICYFRVRSQDPFLVLRNSPYRRYISGGVLMCIISVILECPWKVS